MDKDIDKLNSIKDLNELKNYLIDGLKDKTETFSETIMDLIEEYKEQLMIRSRDFSKYKTNRRLLSFALYKISFDNRDIYRQNPSISTPMFDSFILFLL
jgi:predicted class III extradiol MEMO1 family dioxygenase